MKKKKIVIFLYNRLFDPLIQSGFWLYIQDYLNDSDSPVDFHLITYENPKFPLTDKQRALVQKWQSNGLKWKQLCWNPGTGMKAKAMDIVQGFFAVINLRMKGYRYALSLTSVSGTFLYLYSLFVRNKYFLYSFEPHSEYAVDNEMWPKSGLQYKLSHFLERRAAKSARVIASGTRFMQERVENEWKVRAAFFKIPIVVNDKKFFYNSKDRSHIRTKLNIDQNQNLLFYPGKFGGLYYNEEFAWMFRWLKEEIDNLHFLIVTPHKDEEVIELFEKAGVSRNHYTIAHSDYSEIHTYYSAADFAVISVPPGPSKKFISNIKVGEYLCAGLPFLITRGVSEDYIYALEKNVGVVVNDFKEEHIRPAASEVLKYLKADRTEQRQHCREVGLDYRGFNKLNTTFKEAINALTA